MQADKIISRQGILHLLEKNEMAYEKQGSYHIIVSKADKFPHVVAGIHEKKAMDSIKNSSSSRTTNSIPLDKRIEIHALRILFSMIKDKIDTTKIPLEYLYLITLPKT